MNKINWKKTIKWAGTIISLGLFVWLLTRLDWKEAWTIIKDMSACSYVLAVVLLLAGQFFNSLRWFVLLRAQDVKTSIPRTFAIHMGGTFASNFLPSTIGGDSLRFLAIAKVAGDQSLSLASVILDRLVNLLATFTLIPFSVSVLKTTGLQFDNNLLGFSILAVFQGKFGVWLKRILKKYLDLFKRWFKKPYSLLLAFTISWFSRFVILGAVWVLSMGVGMNLTLWQVVGINTVSYFITLIPISISGYGLREITLTTLYTMLGATLEQATALTVITRIFSTAITLPGVIWMQQILADTKEIKRQTDSII